MLSSQPFVNSLSVEWLIYVPAMPAEEVEGARIAEMFFLATNCNLIEWRLATLVTESKGLFLIRIQRGQMTRVLDR